MEKKISRNGVGKRYFGGEADVVGIESNSVTNDFRKRLTTLGTC
jgi:hypothetical protein